MMFLAESEGRIEASEERLKLTRISSTELQRTGSVRSSSAFSNQLLKAEAFLANNRNKSSTLNKTENEPVSDDFFMLHVNLPRCNNDKNKKCTNNKTISLTKTEASD